MLKIPLTVADGATTSPWYAIEDLLGTQQELEDYAIAGLATPASLEATSARLEFSLDGSAALPFYNDTGGQITITVAASRLQRLKASEYPVLTPHVRLVLGTAASGASRTCQLILRKV